MTIVLLLAVALARTAATAPVPFSNPPELVSTGGVLSGTLTAAPADVVVGGRRVTTDVYGGLYMPPLLRVQPGKTIALRLQNASSEHTNIHYHGLAVTPLGNGDNVFLDVAPGTSLTYGFEVPADHPAGLFWYHPHFHPMVNPQIAAGLSGGIVIGDILAPFPELRGRSA